MYIPRRNRQAARKTTEPQMISIVIPSRYNEKRIGRTLAGIFAQNRRDFEVLSCDDNSAARTPAILAYYPEIRRFRMPEACGSAAAISSSSTTPMRVRTTPTS